MEREQRAAGHAEILAARLAAPARSAVALPAVIHGRALAARAHRLAVRAGPADADEGRLGFLVGHAQDRAQTERPGLG